MKEKRQSFALSYAGIPQLLSDLEGKFSRQGVRFRSAKPVSIGDEVEILVRVPDSSHPLPLLGEVAWLSPEQDAEGKRVVLVRNLRLTPEAEQRIALLRTPPHRPSPLEGIEEAEVEFPPPQGAPPPAPLGNAPEKPEKRRSFLWLYITLGVVLLSAGIATWLVFGGLRWIQMNFLAPHEFVNLPPPPVVVLGAEPELPKPEAPPPPPPPPRKLPPLILKEFDYYQRPQENEFIFGFTRPPFEVVEEPGGEPGQVVLFVSGSRSGLEKEQYFFPFEYVQSVLFDEGEGGGLRIIFFGKNPSYIPKPQWEIRGRELVVRFVPST